MPFVRPSDMLSGRPLPGWSGRFVHSANMTFAHWDIEAGAAALHEHQHEQEEVWHIVAGEVALTVAGEEQVLGAGCVAVIPPHTPHSAARYRPAGPSSPTIRCGLIFPESHSPRARPFAAVGGETGRRAGV